MSEEPKPTPRDTAEPAPPEAPRSERDEDTEIGDFITRQVLEKDAVFFEG